MLSPGIVLQQRYRIKRLLARGGMGAVYEAEDGRLGNATVAVKETFFSEDRLREQFQREAATLARLRHQSLPKVTDHFSEGAGLFLVMDFIAGDDIGALLDQRLKIKGEPFEFRQVVEWAERLLDALVYIHGQYPPVIHRDIKPQNLKLTPLGDLFLIDFGLAKDAATSTRPGFSVHGYTLEFAPPEQIKGAGTDMRSDLYSLGATLYHLATGVLPPDARIREESVVKHLMPDLLQPAHHVNPRIPFAFSAILAKAMALDREQRYQSAQEMREALRQIKRNIDSGIAEGEQREAERRRLEEEEHKRKEEEARQREEERKRREEEARWREIERRRQIDEAARLQALQEELSRKEEELAKLKRALPHGAVTEPEVRQPVADERRIDREKAAREAAAVAPAVRWKPPRVALGAIAASILIALLAYLLWSYVNSTSDKTASLPRAETMLYWLELENDAGKLVSGLDPLPAGKRFQLHFSPAASGYLYLIAPGEGGALTTFVTKRRIEAGADFQFPGGDNWINVGEGARFTVIFSPELLNELPYLNGDGRRLTLEEQNALRDFGDRLTSTSPETRASNDGAVVTAQKRSDEPLVFDINIVQEAPRK